MEGTVGDVLLWAPEHAPRGWAFCDGRLFSPGRQPELFALLGTQYGGDGVTTFALPDCRDPARHHAHVGQRAQRPMRFIICIRGAHPDSPSGKASGSRPVVGTVKLVALERPPAGWLLCQGQLLQAQDYPELSQAIGTRFGGDAARGQFRVPDMSQGPQAPHLFKGFAPQQMLRYVICYRGASPPRA